MVEERHDRASRWRSTAGLARPREHTPIFLGGLDERGDGLVATGRMQKEAPYRGNRGLLAHKPDGAARGVGTGGPQMAPVSLSNAAPS